MHNVGARNQGFALVDLDLSNTSKLRRSAKLSEAAAT